MPDYVYLLEHRLSPTQQTALKQVRDVAREHGMTVFLTGGAIRDLSTGFPVRDLDFSVQGNALKLKKSLEKAGAKLWGEHEPSRTLFFWFHGVRIEVSSARRESYPKPGKPVYEWAPILEDLRRRDFTANAMAVSLNEGSYGLLLDPLNGIADIEARTLRLVSPYGFIEDPSRLLRAVRLQARTGWELDERSKTRYQNAKDEETIAAISPYLKGYELEEIGHEEDALKALKALEHEGWMKHLYPAWTAARADAHALEQLHQTLLPLLIQGIHPDISAAQMELLTAKLQPKDLSALKKLFPRPGFVTQWEALEEDAKEFQKELLDKKNAAPSATWKLLTSYAPEPVLWLAYTSKNAQVQAKFKNFLTVWPEVRQKIPTLLMLEMRIVPELPGYEALVQEIFFQLMDGKLSTEEEMRAFLEPHSPPAPPPPVSIKRSRSKRSEAKSRIDEDEDELDEDALPSHDDDDDGDLGSDDEDEEEEHDEPLPKPVKAKATAAPVEAPKAHATKPVVEKTAPPAPAKTAPPAKKAPAKAVAAKPAHPVSTKKVVETKKPVKAAPAPAKKATKPAPKPPAKVAKKPLPKPVKKPVSKPAPKATKKPVAKPAKKKR
jgi:tRNA nucleotidyltransferase (CCA-adding enzyme)